MKRILSLRLTPLLVVLVAFMAVLSLAIHSVHIFAPMPSTTEVLHVRFWVPFALAAAAVTGLIICLLRRGLFRIVGISVFILASVFYPLSLRSVEYIPGDAHVTETWLGIPVSAPILLAPDDGDYCAAQTSWFLELRSTRSAVKFRFFRGVWPSYFSEFDVRRDWPVMQLC